MTACPSWRARALRRLQNRLHHAGIIMTLNTSDETLERLKAEVERCDALELQATRQADLHAAAKFVANRGTLLQALHRIQRDRELAGLGDEEPEAVEAKAVEFLRSRGWTIRVESKEAVK